MYNKLTHILQRIDSRHLSQLWTFFRDSFQNDEECLTFIYDALRLEPIYTMEQAFERAAEHFDEDDYIDPEDKYFIPRRMMNSVERLVSAARDMEQIRQGKDVFKIVFLVTCVETLQKLRGKDAGKWKMLSDFFENYTINEDKAYIRRHFCHVPDWMYPEEDNFSSFVSALNEYRNAAAHEGEYWEYCFMNSSSETPLSLQINVHLSVDPKNRKKVRIFETSLSYRDFEAIFIRTCISFINSYVHGMSADADNGARI